MTTHPTRPSQLSSVQPLLPSSLKRSLSTTFFPAPSTDQFNTASFSPALSIAQLGTTPFFPALNRSISSSQFAIAQPPSSQLSPALSIAHPDTTFSLSSQLFNLLLPNSLNRSLRTTFSSVLDRSPSSSGFSIARLNTPVDTTLLLLSSLVRSNSSSNIPTPSSNSNPTYPPCTSTNGSYLKKRPTGHPGIGRMLSSSGTHR